MANPVIVYRLQDGAGKGGFVVTHQQMKDLLDTIEVELDSAEPGATFSLHVETMSQEDIDALPEWDGF